MANVQSLLDRNAAFAARFDKGDLRIPPQLSLLVITCLDARVDPAHFLGVELGDAFVIRNVGGRVTDEVIEHLAILLGLARVVGGPAFEVAVVHHTDCGTVRFSHPEIRAQLAKASGTTEAAIARLASTDPEATVVEDIGRIRAAPNVPDDLVVSGLVYDVATGRVREAVAPGALGG